MFFEFDDFDVRERFYAIEERTAKLKLFLESTSPKRQSEFQDMCIRAFVYHDSALDGLVVTGEEIASVFAQDTSGPYLRSRILQEIKNHKDALMNHLAKGSKADRGEVYQCDVITYEDVISTHEKLYTNIARKDAGKLRRVVPLHSAYFHSFADPKHVEKKLRDLCKQTEHPEFRAQHPINQAVLFHREFMSVFPFMEGSGKTGRLFMNAFLIQGGYNLAIIHGSERQRYYETLRDGPEALRDLLLDNMESALDSQLKHLSEEEQQKHAGSVALRPASVA